MSNRERKTQGWLKESSKRLMLKNKNGRVPRKRKKYVLNTERANYEAILLAVFLDKVRQSRRVQP